MSALGQATAIVALTRSLAEGLRTGDALVSDARKLEQLLREAEHWLHEARRFLDPAVDRKAAPMADEPALTADTVADRALEVIEAAIRQSGGRNPRLDARRTLLALAQDEELQGLLNEDMAEPRDWPVDDCCDECGKPYGWGDTIDAILHALTPDACQEGRTPPRSVECPWCRGVGRVNGEPCHPCREDGSIAEGDDYWDAAICLTEGS